MLAVVNSDKLFETTSVQKIHYCESKSYDILILKGNATGERHAATEDVPSGSAAPELDFEPMTDDVPL